MLNSSIYSQIQVFSSKQMIFSDCLICIKRYGGEKMKKQTQAPIDRHPHNKDSLDSRKSNVKADELEESSKSDLLAKAREIGITGRHQMSKGELIDAIRNH
ncbi:Rho termination factor N-terminal domain-containing protein [Sphingobacterium sp. WM]|uniref:Rho termination factor N-terminal domain-containing protein n=1 Tax=Sphingobacterium sp. WM TaxID=3031802 RepID=UPI00240DC8E9|nr:Rho termination factor N-terminal domain-containing protein [Sphingobacterium sp. WM]WFB64917.1 Rho termination factor N-terminal domain-containing protein [Sphingobacterium sp. WM]